MAKLINITERIVTEMVDSVMTQEKCCTCEQCRCDVLALTLNKLDPKYVVTDAGDVFETYRLSLAQNQVFIYQAMLEAIQKVKQSPRHLR